MAAKESERCIGCPICEPYVTAHEPQPGEDELELADIVRSVGINPHSSAWNACIAAARAGRARGIEEMGKRCEGIAQEYAARAASWKRSGNGGKAREALAGETAALAIADAIAKETGK